MAAPLRRRSKVYRFNTTENEWKERGTGDVKILQDRETKKCRIVLRQEKTMKLVLNHSGEHARWQPPARALAARHRVAYSIAWARVPSAASSR